MRICGIVISVLFLAAAHMAAGPHSGGDVIAIAAAAENSGGGQGVSGRPQKNGTIKGTPKPNASINGSQSRGKH
jgi:hypothetical protein